MFILIYDKIKSGLAASVYAKDAAYFTGHVPGSWSGLREDAAQFANHGELLAAYVDFALTVGPMPRNDLDGYKIVEV